MTDGIGSSTATSAAAGTATGAAASGANGFDRLGKNEFLKLLVAQLRNQDPMKPMEDREFIAQLAQFNSLEMLQNLDQRLEDLAGAQLLGQAASLIGKQITAGLADGTTISGAVTEVRVIGGVPKLVVGNQEVELNAVTLLTG